MVVASAKKCKARYCADCEVELTEIDKVRQAKTRQEAKKKRYRRKSKQRNCQRRKRPPKSLRWCPKKN